MQQGRKGGDRAVEKGSILSLIIPLAVVLIVLYFANQWYTKTYLPNKAMKKDNIPSYIKSTAGPELTASGLFSRTLRKVPVMNKYRANLKARLSQVDPGDDISLDNECGKLILKGLETGIGVILAIIVMCIKSPDNAFLVIASGCVIAFVAFDGTINSKINKMENRMLSGLGDAMTSIRHYYEQTKRVDDAVYMALPDQNELVKKHLDIIYRILQSPDPKKSMMAYNRKQNNVYLQLFMATAVSTKEDGASKTDDGTDSFLKNTESLKEELNSELIRKKKNDIAFSGIEMMTLMPIAFLKPLEIWATTNMPMIVPYYNGVYGTVAVIAVMIVTYLCYRINSLLKEGSAEMKRADSIWAKFGDREPFNTWLSDYLGLRKNYTKYLKLDRMQKGIGDHSGAKALLLKQCVLFVTTFIVTLILFISGTISTSISSLHDFATDFKDVVGVSEDYKLAMEATAAQITAQAIADHNPPDINSLQDSLQTQGYNGKKYTATQANTIATAIESHYKSHMGAYFKWWYILASLAAAIIAYYTPVLMLKFSAKSIEARRAAEMMRFESMMMILIYVPGTDVYSILDWMERFANAYQETITQCQVEIGAGQERALRHMKDSENSVAFKSFCDNLMAIDQVGVKAAFDEVASDRAYLLKKREQDSNAEIEHKSSLASKIAFVPFYVILVMYLLLPWVRYAINLFQSFQSVVG